MHGCIHEWESHTNHENNKSIWRTPASACFHNDVFFSTYQRYMLRQADVSSKTNTISLETNSLMWPDVCSNPVEPEHTWIYRATALAEGKPCFSYRFWSQNSKQWYLAPLTKNPNY
jgi:hypothetical protein